MTRNGLITLVITWSIVLFTVIRLFIRVLRTPQAPYEDEE
jgi:hypothetical protein